MPGRRDRKKKYLQVLAGDGRGEGRNSAVCGPKIRVSDAVTASLVPRQILHEHPIYNRTTMYVLYIYIHIVYSLMYHI